MEPNQDVRTAEPWRANSKRPWRSKQRMANKPPFPQHLCRPARSSQRSPPSSPSPSSSSSSTANPPSSHSPIRASLPLVVLSAPGFSTRTRATPSSCKIVRSSSASGRPRSDRAYCPCYTFPFPSLIRVPICTPPFSFDAWILRPPPLPRFPIKDLQTPGSTYVSSTLVPSYKISCLHARPTLPPTFRGLFHPVLPM